MFIRLLCNLAIALFFLPSFAFTSETPGTLVVKLPTKSQLFKAYLPSLQEESSEFSPRYLLELHQILAFDVGYNGMTQVVKETSSLRSLSRLGTPSQKEILSYQKEGIHYLIQTTLTNKTLKTSIVTINTGTIQTLSPIELSGELSSDRRLIHQVADTIHEALFGVPGIASTRLLYTLRHRHTSDSSKWVSEVWESDYDGKNANQVTHESALCVTPSYIPPSKPGHRSSAFLFVSYKTGQPKIYLASLHDGIGHRFSYLPGNQLMPSISASLNKVLFVSDVASNPDLYLQSFNTKVGAMGKPQQIFAKKGATQGSPVFNPEGNKVAFVSNKDGPPRIYVMDLPQPRTNVKELHPKLITRINRENSAPSWSPDGTKLAYCAKTDGVRQIWIYDFASEKEQQLTHGNDNKENPCWAPNSRHLIFNSASESRSELYLVNLNQPEAVRITSGSGEKRFPSWEPRSF